MGQLRFDPTISLGTIITIATIFFGIIRLSGQIAVIEFKVNHMWRYLNKRMHVDESDSE